MTVNKIASPTPSHGATSLGNRITYEIGEPAAVTLHSNCSHESDNPTFRFRTLVRKHRGCPTALVVELLGLKYQSTSGENHAGEPLFTVEPYAAGGEYVLIADVESGSVIRREVAPVGLAQLPTSFEACVTAYFSELRQDQSVDNETAQISGSAQRVIQALANCDDGEIIKGAAKLNLELITLLGRRHTGLLVASREAFYDLKSNTARASLATHGLVNAPTLRWMPGCEVSFGEFEHGILFRDEGAQLQVLIEEGMLVTWEREKDGQTVQVTHVAPSKEEMEKHCVNGAAYRGFTCTHFANGRAEFSDGDIDLEYSVLAHPEWELESWAGVKLEIDRFLMH